ncbi:MAG: SIMPL domain-containing protein [Rhodospirillales bacterium]|nr:SIMPL domain-containing protein [Rhodospirillales bacterium]
MRFALPVLFCLPLYIGTLSAAAQAQDYQTILNIPAGQTLVNLSATERAEVEQDLLIATLRFEAENEDPKALQNRINEVMTKAVDTAKKYKGVKVTTQQYYVHPYDYDPDPRPYNKGERPKLERTWRGNQGIQIKGTAADEVLELTGTLQDMGLTMNGLNYTLSPELMEQTHESLLEAALQKLTAKADRAAKALGKSSSDLREVNVDMGGGFPQPQPMMRGMAMSAEMAPMAAPVASPGESTITLTVSARAMLK